MLTLKCNLETWLAQVISVCERQLSKTRSVIMRGPVGVESTSDSASEVLGPREIAGSA